MKFYLLEFIQINNLILVCFDCKHEVDTLEIDAIVGNDSNGGEDPDAAGEDLYVMYKTPAMDQFRFTIMKPDGSFPPGKDGSSTDDVIIPLGASGNSGLNKYSVEITARFHKKRKKYLN